MQILQNSLCCLFRIRLVGTSKIVEIEKPPSGPELTRVSAGRYQRNHGNRETGETVEFEKPPSRPEPSFSLSYPDHLYMISNAWDVLPFSALLTVSFSAFSIECSIRRLITCGACVLDMRMRRWYMMGWFTHNTNTTKETSVLLCDILWKCCHSIYIQLWFDFFGMT